MLAEREGGGTYSASRQEARTASTHLRGPVVSRFKKLTEQKAYNRERMKSGEERRTERAQHLDLFTFLWN